jgi:hypothetical protein
MIIGSEALRYLTHKDVFYINLARSDDRRVQWAKNVRNLFQSCTRVEGIDGVAEITDHQATAFVENWWRLYEEKEINGLGFANKPPGKSFRMATAKANLAIMQSHCKAIETGLNHARGDTFFVAEDDIMPRSSLWAEVIPQPPDDADVAIWSGGLLMASVSADSTFFQNGRRHKWRTITPDKAFNTLGAGLYEMTRPAARYVKAQVEANPMSFDHAWGFALKDLIVYRLDPQGFAQVGPSIRNTSDRRPVLSR